MIRSSGPRGATLSHSVELPVRTLSGASSARVLGGGHAVVAEHSHDWPVLSLYVMCRCRKVFDGGEVEIAAPGAVLHGAGAAHANRLGAEGLEQIDIQFDPAWFGDERTLPLGGVRCWLGGTVAAGATRLAARWADADVPEAVLACETRRFVVSAMAATAESAPAWLPAVLDRLQISSPPTALDLGRELGLHPTWLAQAYRRSMGEGLRQTLQRRRVERAAMLLRESDAPAAEIAADVGFCDQSHMNRAFRGLLGRTPLAVRAERTLIAAAAAA